MTKGTKASRAVPSARRGKRAVRHLHAAEDCHAPGLGADHSAQLTRLNRIVGQVQGIGRMIESRRYCPDILLQTRAAVSAIRSLESGILEDHLRHCVKKAFAATDETEADAVIQELLELYAMRD